MADPRSGARGAARGVDDGAFVEVRGEPQWLALRGDDRRNPPLLILPGPGVALSGLAPWFAPWEAHFTLAHWDAPFAGATYGRNGPPADYGLDRLMLDAAAVAQTVLARGSHRRLIVLGSSGGSVIGLRLARQRPDLVSAFVGTGQIVHWARQEAQSYRLILDRARAAGDVGSVAALERFGPPPWVDLEADVLKGQLANAPTPLEAAALAALGPTLAAAPPGGAWRAHGQPAHDVRAVATAAYARLKPELAAFDAWALGDFATPLIFLPGAEDLHTPPGETEAFARQARAPRVVFDPLPGVGHASLFVRDLLLHHLLAALAG
ncbi:alpha/beta fold hydrolase [Caulobacter sp. KR2-114]|uniref:alpha/beta fold hydrolase n=1 Tax=Caulobacter sp. KR2-114 TaxID=3400912 RepID=UPI003BFE2E0E